MKIVPPVIEYHIDDWQNPRKANLKGFFSSDVKCHRNLKVCLLRDRYLLRSAEALSPTRDVPASSSSPCQLSKVGAQISCPSSFQALENPVSFPTRTTTPDFI